MMDDGRADLSRSGFSVRVEGGSGTVGGLDVIERTGEKRFDLLGWQTTPKFTEIDVTGLLRAGTAPAVLRVADLTGQSDARAGLSANSSKS